MFFVRYLFRIAPLPHATGIISLAVGFFCFSHGFRPGAASVSGVLLLCWAFCWFALTGLCLADGLSRHREYLRIKRILLCRGFSPRLASIMAHSRCQRDAALQAARELGHEQRMRSFFHARGYRWYHLLPDGIRRNPLLFLNPAFLKKTFLPSRKN